MIADTAKRILIEAPQLSGSFSLQGTRIDDIILTDYRETLDADSDNIHFLKKLSTNSPYFAEFGWAVTGSDHQMPRADTLWSTNADILSTGSPVTLRWNNGNGLEFVRTISIDDHYMITFEDRYRARLERPSPYTHTVLFADMARLRQAASIFCMRALGCLTRP